MSYSASNSTSKVSSPEEEGRKTKFRRNYRACLNCRLRKVKCDLGSVDNPVEGKCARCRRERKDCVFVESKRGGTNSSSKKRKTSEFEPPFYSPKPEENIPYANQPSTFHTQSNYQLPTYQQSYQEGYHRFTPDPPSSSETQPKESQTPQTDTGHFSTMEGALVYLAKAAGTIAKADERDNIDADKRHQQLEEDMNSDGNGSGNTVNEGSLSERVDNYKKIMAEAVGGQTKIPKHIQDQSNYMSIPITNEFSIRPKGANKLSNIDYIGEYGLLTEYEAEMLVNLFFTTMHPYFPHIPLFLHKPQVLAGYPILLCAILTISSRYHSLDDNPNNITTGNVDGVPRNIEIHDKLWLYVQRLISQTVWAEASTRSVGTVFAFLLLTEWNPRAIHWRWTDYANRPEDSNGCKENDEEEPKNKEQNLAGLGAMRRSYRMAWMLIGSAVRLAQDMGFMEVSPKTFLATHISEINSVMNISRRSMLSHSLSELEVDDENTADDGDTDFDHDYKIQSMSEEEIKEKSREPMRFSFRQKAKIELLQIMSLSNESLYGYKAQLGKLTQRQNLAVLSILSPLLGNWERKYKKLMKPSNYKNYNLSNSNLLLEQSSKLAHELHDCIEHESYIFEFNYAKLYVYSLALSSTPKTEVEDLSSLGKKGKKTRVNLKLDEISKSAKYIEQAFFAANEMLAVGHRVHKLKMLRFMPVRWVTRIVRAVAFIVKCYLTITAHKRLTTNVDSAIIGSDNFDATILSLSLIPVDEIMHSIKKAAITLRDCSPDELHLCTRYSNVLMYLCSEMKSKTKNSDEFSKSTQQPSSFHQSLSQGDSTNQVFLGRGGSHSGSTSSVNLNQYLQAQNEFNKPFNSGDKPQMSQVVNDSDMNLNDNFSAPEISTPLNNMIGDSEVMEWFMTNKNVGLDFVGPWTEMIEQQLNDNDEFNFEEALL